MPARMQSWGKLEAAARRTGHTRIVGVDEVGRGPLAGPVVACAILLPHNCHEIKGVGDSKSVPAAERERLATVIRRRAIAIGIGAASVCEIDRVNIYQATALAMRRAIARIPAPHDLLLVDGSPFAALGLPHRNVVKGDACCLSIACASIIAKVTRDRLLCALNQRYPAYGWQTNAGYGTPEHLAALTEHGATPHHRRSFRPLRIDAPDLFTSMEQLA
ncbi:MAG TPA: ribonuclease HII [Gemmatimonadaceae bacterium]|nr:ribonuclease HII [Gemmatimonadaceae bacterium]